MQEMSCIEVKYAGGAAVSVSCIGACQPNLQKGHAKLHMHCRFTNAITHHTKAKQMLDIDVGTT